MALVKDFAVEDATGDLLIVGGDFELQYSDQQHTADIIKSYLGWWKEFPFLGVGIELYLKSSGTRQELERLIKVQLEADGFKVNKIDISDFSNIIIDAERANY